MDPEAELLFPKGSNHDNTGPEDGVLAFYCQVKFSTDMFDPHCITLLTSSPSTTLLCTIFG